MASVVEGLVNWADPDAVTVQTDVAQVLAARTPQAKSKANASLQAALKTMNAQRAAVDAVLQHAITSLALHASPPKLPG